MGHIAQLTAQIYASVPGTKHALADAGSGASVQPTEASFAGMRWEVNNGHRVKRADWSPEMVRVLDAAMVILDAIRDDESVAAAHYTDPGDDAWRHLRWCMRNTKYEPEINPLGYLYAQMLVLSRESTSATTTTRARLDPNRATSRTCSEAASWSRSMTPSCRRTQRSSRRIRP